MLYHLDVGHRLKSGQVIDLAQNKLSVFGANYMRKFMNYGVQRALDSGDPTASLRHLDAATYREYALEFFRRHHPVTQGRNLPSRLSGFFATSSLDDAHRYAERHGFKGSVRIYEVLADGTFPTFDMTWLDRTFPPVLDGNTSYYWNKYWAGERFELDEQLNKNDQRPALMETILIQKIAIGNRVV